MNSTNGKILDIAFSFFTHLIGKALVVISIITLPTYFTESLIGLALGSIILFLCFLIDQNERLIDETDRK